jgi:hypothetical protein
LRHSPKIDPQILALILTPMDILKGLHKEFGWFIWGLVGLGIIWYFTGGAERESSKGGQYIKPLAPLDTGEVYGKYYAGTPNRGNETLELPESPADVVRNVESKIADFLTLSEEAKQIHLTSLLAKRISFDGIAGAKSSKVHSEYLRILASEYATGPIGISGLLLRGIGYDSNVIIPRAAELPILGTTVIKKDVYLPPGGRALVSSGRSPIGTSFRANICTGYLDQFQDYVPDLRRDCPSAVEELRKTELSGEDACIEFVEKIPRCRIFEGRLPNTISGACRVFITEKLNYNSCVASHKSEKYFYADEWRIFLDQTEELWKEKNEIIRLMDAKGGTIDAITY